MMEPTTTNHPMRNPLGFVEQYDEIFKMAVLDRQMLDYQTHQVPLNVICNKLMSYSGSLGCGKYIAYQYGCGAPLTTLVTALQQELPVIRDAIAFVRQHASEHADAYVVYGSGRRMLGFAALALLLLPAADLLTLTQLITPLDGQRGYLLDLYAKAFIDGHPLSASHSADHYAEPWSRPLQAILAQPAAQRAPALAAHMKNWCGLMRPFGWKAKATLNDMPFFNDFAFEVALAVCAYDIDDSSFSEHPYYPRDLVEFYRSNLRHSRDAWRAFGVGAGVPVAAPAPLPRANLASSSRRGLARWVELVCDGAPAPTEVVLGQIGQQRKITDLDQLMDALDEADHAIHADINDDDALSLQTGLLATALGLGQYDVPAGPPFRVARCGAMLRDFAGWCRGRGYCLIDLDGDDDAWHAVLVRTDYQAEFFALSAALGVTARPAPLLTQWCEELADAEDLVS